MTQFSPHPPPTTDIVLERIGFYVSDWDQLNWYVQFTKKELGRLSKGDLLNLQEEINAIATTTHHVRGKRPPPTLEQIIEIQQAVTQYLKELVDRRFIKLPPMPISRHIQLFDWDETDDEDNVVEIKEYNLGGMQIEGEPESLYKNQLLHHLFDLLEKLGRSLKRCPKCHLVFLQLRRHARYCSRQCQSRAVMTRKRDQERQKRTRKVAKKGEG